MHFNPYSETDAYTLKQDQCFIVMPYGQSWSAIISEHIKDACSAQGLSAVRGDDGLGANILHDIWRDMNESRAVIVDVTGNNPNVMYELGLAHALKKDVILLAQSAADIPFDLSVFRHILYERTDAGLTSLDEQLARCLVGLFHRGPDNFGKAIGSNDYVLLFLSTGGTCRCAMSNVITRYLLCRQKTQEGVENGPPGLKPISAAVAQPHMPQMSDQAQLVVKKRLGIDGKRHNTLHATMPLVNRADLILEMASGLAKTWQPQCGEKIKLFTEFFGGTGDIVDPWGKSDKEYERCFDRFHSILAANTRKLASLARRAGGP
jgi:protein-tyrosine-phosphatase